MFVFVYVCAWLAAVGDQRSEEESFLMAPGEGEKKKKKFAAEKMVDSAVRALC